ncbi:KRAB-A domain-containing protein 2 [Trichinella papuae]|uniref:KRAB-A domain-containing protein 2 n=1 Tax=Trichinella papuae TaxID=268474 RepID=A0A0V1MSF6_9BILA|nr:KRAB-A domain-containing protein 2 [Trichinella papuae]
MLSMLHYEKIGHGGEKKTFREAQNKWANVTQEACHLFLTFCEECHKKRARKLPKSLVVKPLDENECKRWSMGLKFVQWQINVSVHETTGQSPFKVTFGEEPRIGLESYVLPKSLVDAAKTEE